MSGKSGALTCMTLMAWLLMYMAIHDVRMTVIYQILIVHYHELVL